MISKSEFHKLPNGEPIAVHHQNQPSHLSDKSEILEDAGHILI